MDKDKVRKMRYTKVLQSFTDNYVVKLIASGVLWFWATLQDIFTTNGELILLLVIAVCIDWITGHLKAKKDGVQILSIGWRQTVLKVVEYGLFMAMLIGISNVFGESGREGWVADMLSLAKNIDWLGYFYLIMTELKSISENLSGEKNIFTKIYKLIKEKIGIDAQ